MNQKYKYISFRKKDISEDKFIPVINQEFFCKPKGGLWGSPYTPDGEYLSEWHRFTIEEFKSAFSENAVLFNLKETARIYTIDSMQDLIRFTNKYSLEPTVDIPIKHGFLKCWDFERASEDYDVIYLTAKGEAETRLPPSNLPSFYGWDVESILVLNFDAIADWKYMEVE